ncbi:hypothetical protein Vadar_032941 [Vaccinium darrowii]|uniref:Uncharacterized protein n=1 Tax=Vaccinium darrowii TaxID=229202 RepID=A0ACB7XLR6_9ERIC|nr:hypothetical protein Vadar_032941 [Vaccinium darrowii]
MPVMVAQPSQLPTLPMEETNQLSSPSNVVGGMGSSSIPSTQRRRGPTRGVNVDKLRKKLGHPIPVEIDREAMAIVGDYATPVANAIGESIRAHAPVRDIGWGAVEFGIRESIVLRVASQPDVINPLSEEQVSVEVLGKRSGYLKGYGIHRSRYGTQSQGLPNSEVVALKQQVVDQGKIMADQGKVIADYGKIFEKMMLMLASGVDPATIPGLIQGTENGDDASGGDQDFY